MSVRHLLRYARRKLSPLQNWHAPATAVSQSVGYGQDREKLQNPGGKRYGVFVLVKKLYAKRKMAKAEKCTLQCT